MGARWAALIERKLASCAALQRIPKISRTRGGSVPLMMWFWTARLPRAARRDRLAEGDQRCHLQRVLGRVQLGRGELSLPPAREFAIAPRHLAARQAEQLAEAHVVLPERLALAFAQRPTNVSYIARPESAITASVHSISSGSKAE